LGLVNGQTPEAARELAFTKFPKRCHPEFGVLLNIEEPKSTMYRAAHLISSNKMTEFADSEEHHVA